MPVLLIANLNNLLAYVSGLGASAELAQFERAVEVSRQHYEAVW
jgi:hypothetical protein